MMFHLPNSHLYAPDQDDEAQALCSRPNYALHIVHPQQRLKRKAIERLCRLNESVCTAFRGKFLH